MSKRKIAYARKNILDPEEEGEELPFPPRDIVIHKDYWFDRDYELQDDVLGRGKFGEVIRCTEISSGMVLAAKIVTARKENEKADVQKEIKIMAQLRHPKILQIYDAFESKRKMCIITEIVEGGELFDRIIDESFDLTERVAILFMRQIIDGIMYIHSQNILHLDMKPENIICVAKTGTRIKIIDFGLAQRYDSFSGTKIMAGTIDFMSPEVCNYEDVTPATDMWSIGVICYVLVSGLSPFMGDDDADTICNILRVEFDFAAEEFEEITAGCKDFIKKLLVKDPRKRMSAADCMKHSWLNKITRSQTNKHLSKKHHIKFFTRRKWRKVIRAVMALNRMKRLAQMRRAESETQSIDIDSERPTEVKGAEIPGWRKRMEARIKLGEARAAHKSKTEELAALTNNHQATRAITSTLSGSSGYESSGSSKSGHDETTLEVKCEEEEVTTPVADKCNPFNESERDLERMESVDTLMNDEVREQSPETCDARERSPSTHESFTDVSQAPRHETENPAEDKDELTREESLTPGLEIESDKETCVKPDDINSDLDKMDNENEIKICPGDSVAALPDEQPGCSSASEGDEVIEFDVEDSEDSEQDTQLDKSDTKAGILDSEQEFLSDSDDESGSYRSDKPCYCPTDTLDNLVTAITSRKDSNNSVRSNNSNRSAGKHISARIDSNKHYNSDEDKGHVSNKSSLTKSEILPSLPPNQSTPPRSRHSSQRSSAGQCSDSIPLMKQNHSGSPLSRYSRKTSRTLSDRSNGSASPLSQQNLPIESSAPEDSSRTSSRRLSNSDGSHENSPGRFARRVPSPAMRYPVSSRNNSSDYEINGDVDSYLPRRQRWSQSPAHELNPEERRRARIANICGEEYTPPPVSPVIRYDPNVERIIPIEIERSPPPSVYDIRSRNRIASVLSTDSVSSDSALLRQRRPDVGHPFRGRVTHSPLRNEVECFGGAVKVRVRSSPARGDSFTGLSRTRESPSRGSSSSMDARRARIAAIMAEDGSNENLTKDRIRQSPSRGSDSSYVSGTSTDRRRARIAAIMSDSQESLNSDDSTQGRQRNCDPIKRVVTQSPPPGSRSASRNNSDDARQRRIAAILSGQKNEDS